MARVVLKNVMKKYGNVTAVKSANIVCEDKEFKKTMASIGQPIDYLNTKDWAAFIPKAYKDYEDMIKELDIKI